MKYLIGFVFVCAVSLVPAEAFAQQGSIMSVYGDALSQQAAQTGGLVTCNGISDCNLCTFGELVNNIINWLFGVLTVLAVIVLAVAGFRLVTSGGDVEQMRWAKERIVYVIIGFILMLAAWLIVDTILRGLTGSQNGMAFWGSFDVENCGFTTLAVQQSYPEYELEDAEAIAASNPGAYNTGLNSTCNPSTPNFPNCAVSVSTNDNMNPIFDCASGSCSSLVRDGAAERMQETLNGPFAELQDRFGRPLVINDAIAKNGTSRESNTPNSRHFYGDALDISLAGMSNSDRIRLYNEARAAGFRGFGFGNNILHIDRRPQPAAWAYGNSTYGGQNVNGLISQVRNY